MVADIARVTYDPTRQYRSLISQQGRVTLEADNNESVMLESEALRLETIDIVGPAGTPDDGYKVSAGPGLGEIIVGPGIFYLGGWRLEHDKAVHLGTDPNSVSVLANVAAVDFQREGNFVVALLITEQSVGAVEDQALREVALGGPDSAARSRLMQHFPRIPLNGDTCALGATAVADLLAAEGVTIDPYSLQLMSSATLQAGFVPGPANTDPCTPAAAGGYLGADNQLVRVTVTKFDAKTQTGVLLWGWNNASLLYRATVLDPLTLTLATTPVDQEHAPQQNQMVEILRTELDLKDGDFIAEGQGFVTSLAQGYSFDTQEIVLSNPLPAAYQNNKNPLFVRLWQAQVDFNGGQQTPLDSVSGITVAIAMTALPKTIAARPFWRFAVRPSTPQNIYPQRYADTPQPPDGPRQWIADLAVCGVLDGKITVLDDCRPSFLPLTGQTAGGCCGLVLGPGDVAERGGLQAVVDGLAGTPSVLSLKPGDYDLPKPLVLDKRHGNLTIEGCAQGVVLKAAAADLTPFRLGLIEIAEVKNINLRQLDFLVPAVPIKGVKGAVNEGAPSTLCGVLVGVARGLVIEDCTFTLEAPSVRSFGAGIMVIGATSQVTITGNTFTGVGRGELVCGVLAWVTETNASTELNGWDISGNHFSGLAVAALGYGQLGLISCCGNLVVNSSAGFIFAEANLGATGAFTREALVNTESPQNAVMGQAAHAILRPDILNSVVTGGDLIVSAMTTPPATPTVSDQARKVLSDQLKASGTEVLRNLSASAGQAGAAAAQAAPPTANAPTDALNANAAAGALNTDAFDQLDKISLTGEIYELELTPALRVEDNEITLTAAVATPWTGIGVILSPDEPGSVIVSGNRVVVPDATTVACGLLFPDGAVVTGNLLVQKALAPQGSKVAACLIVLTASPAIMVSANMVLFLEFILPVRASAAPSASWDFLNTVA